MASRCPLPPFPTGWCCLGLAREVPRGAVVTRRVAGEDVVVFRTASGEVGVVEAYCPHMGAHLGHGGTVVAEAIRCPFHGFRFDRLGTCVATGYGTEPPAKACLRTWPVREVSGFIMTWHDSAGRAPLWELPEPVADGWGPLYSASWTVHCHPQEIVENTADVGHLHALHGYASASLADTVADGHVLIARFAMHRALGLFGTRGRGMRVEFEIRCHGLGFSTVDVLAPDLGIACRQFLLVTPMETDRVRFRIAMKTRRVPGKASLIRLTPRLVFDQVISRAMFREFARDVRQDLDVWDHKRYVTTPPLARGDGPIGKYRSWARQFYPGLPSVAADS
jgi:nitrite reductase/ring-hydroxylating ferredoxin subunit